MCKCLLFSLRQRPQKLSSLGNIYIKQWDLGWWHEQFSWEILFVSNRQGTLKKLIIWSEDNRSSCSDNFSELAEKRQQFDSIIALNPYTVNTELYVEFTHIYGLSFCMNSLVSIRHEIVNWKCTMQLKKMKLIIRNFTRAS